MKKRIFSVWVLLMANTFVFSQNKKNDKDTIRNIELPAAMIKTSGITMESSIKKLNQAVIQKQNQGQDIPYLLNGISSVVVYSDAGAGTGYTGLRIRGADITRINVTMNGVPVNDPESQATFFVNTPDLLSSAQQVEVSKGVGSSKSGVGNFGAGIAINNLDINDKTTYIRYYSDAGSFNTFKNTLKLSTGLIDNQWISTIRLSHIQSDGYIERSSSNLHGLQWTTAYMPNDNTKITFNYIKGKEKTGQAWNGVPQDSLHTRPTYNELGLKSDGTYYNNQTDNYGQDYYQLFVDHKLNSHFSLGTALFYTKGKGYYEEYKMQQKLSKYGWQDADTNKIYSDIIRQLWLDNDFYGARAYATFLSKKWDAGIYINTMQYKGKHFGEVIWSETAMPYPYRWYDVNAQKNETNAYALVDFKPTALWSIFADMQYRNVNYTLNGFRNNPTLKHQLVYHFFNPKIKITYKTTHHTLSLLSGIAQKEPNRDDIEAGKTDIPRAEKLWNTELDYFYKPNSQWMFHINTYSMYYKDQLVLTGKINDVGAYTRSNIDKSYRLGIESDLQYNTKDRIFSMALNMAISQNKLLYFTEYIDNYDDGTQAINNYTMTDIAFSPSLIAGATFSIMPLAKNREITVKNISLDLMPKYISKQYLDNTSNENRIIPSFFVCDAITTLPITISNEKTKIILRAGIYNIFNKRYVANGYTFSYIYDNILTTQNYYYPQATRRWMLGVGVEL